MTSVRLVWLVHADQWNAHPADQAAAMETYREGNAQIRVAAGFLELLGSCTMSAPLEVILDDICEAHPACVSKPIKMLI